MAKTLTKNRPAAPGPARRRLRTLRDLTPDPKNARRHGARNVGTIAASLKEVGAARSIVIDEDGVVLAGNATLEAAGNAGMKLQVVDTDGQTVVAVRRTGLTPEQKTRLALFDNRAAELAEGWDGDIMAELQAAGVPLADLFSADELATLAARHSEDEVSTMATTAEADLDDPRPAPVTAGDYQQFSCPLSVEQERTVRAALRSARQFYQVRTAGEALAAALSDWVSQHP